ncbi:uncharacterized protein LOC134707135 [Mytilus trossulus]|uniref:uncharacterized protein LOC134707135 n=1 Tax=Mytilus trossulus TaxID=6551 RepID=UPI0030071FAA
MEEFQLTLFNKKCNKEKLASLTVFILIVDAVSVFTVMFSCDDRSRFTYGDIISIVVIALFNVCVLVVDIYVVVEALLSRKSDDVSLRSICRDSAERFDDWKWTQKWRHFILRDHRDMKGMISTV